MGRVKIDLAKSNIKALTKEELGLTLEAVQLSSPTDDGVVELRELLAKRYGVPGRHPGDLRRDDGHLPRLLRQRWTRETRSFSSPPTTSRSTALSRTRGAEIKMLERRFERGWQIELEELERRAGRSTRAIVLTNTHNPSGVATSPEKLQTIGQIARENGATVIVDEVYLDSTVRPGQKPAATLGPNLVSIGSLSKVYGPGRRADRLDRSAPRRSSRRRASRSTTSSASCRPPASRSRVAASRRRPELVLRCQQIAMRNFKIIREWIEKRGDLSGSSRAAARSAWSSCRRASTRRRCRRCCREKYGTLVVPGDFFWVRGFIRVSAGMDEDVLRQGLKNVGRPSTSCWTTAHRLGIGNMNFISRRAQGRDCRQIRLRRRARRPPRRGQGQQLLGKERELLVAYPGKGKRLIAAGLGKKDKFTTEKLRRAAAMVGQRARALDLAEISCVPPAGDRAENSQAVVEGIALALYEYKRWKSKTGKPLKLQTVRVDGDADAVRRGEIYARATCLTRDLVNDPPSVCTPRYLADAAKRSRRKASRSRSSTRSRSRRWAWAASRGSRSARPSRPASSTSATRLRRATDRSRSSARASPSTRAASASSPPTACST
jgi:hypothetical protein